MARHSIPGQILGLFGWLGISFAAALVGATASARAAGFYQQLSRPEWAPPAWLFAPVWSCLYLLMGIAAWLVWRERGFREGRGALALFLGQLVLNAAWTWLFFGFRLGAGAFVEILVLWGFILATLMAFWRIRSLAGVLLLPYLGWVTYATALTFAVWRRNPQILGG